MSLTAQTKSFPQDLRISASAPTRVNCGGTWDIPAFALPYTWARPATVNFAIHLRTQVCLSAARPGHLEITSPGNGVESFPMRDLPLNTRSGLIAAIVSTSGVDGVRVEVESQSPPQSGLGGSGSLAVALLAALARFSTLGSGRHISRSALVWQAHMIESSLGISLTGMQDQAAAAYGGANLWVWNYTDPRKPFSREQLVPARHLPGLSSHILVGYTGNQHHSSDVNREWLSDFLGGKNRKLWFLINQNTYDFAQALRDAKWRLAGQFLARESELRGNISTAMVPGHATGLLEQAVSAGCGARFAGAGGGGCVWAIGETDKIARLKEAWALQLGEMGGWLLPATVTARGVTVRVENQPL
jgi:D-glycero-alpha-D-manno-heptose-7-phosphate kinase